MAANGGKYDIALDPLWNGNCEQEAEPFGKEEIAFYQCDHLGTPQELTDHEGKVAWSAQYKAWGKAKEAISQAAYKAGIRNQIRFQGQYLDDETGLHYNRHRYYDPDAARYLTQDPIGLAGGANFYQYAPNSTIWLDPLGLAKYVVIGEGQTSVEAFAAAMRKKRPCDEFRTIGKEWLGLLKQSGAINFPIGSEEWESRALNANGDWIVDRNREGYLFIDVGKDDSPNRSAFYTIERQALHQIGGKVYKGAPTALNEARKNSKPSARPKSKVLCSL